MLFVHKRVKGTLLVCPAYKALVNLLQESATSISSLSQVLFPPQGSSAALVNSFSSGLFKETWPQLNNAFKRLSAQYVF